MKDDLLASDVAHVGMQHHRYQDVARLNLHEPRATGCEQSLEQVEPAPTVLGQQVELEDGGLALFPGPAIAIQPNWWRRRRQLTCRFAVQPSRRLIESCSEHEAEEVKHSQTQTVAVIKGDFSDPYGDVVISRA